MPSNNLDQLKEKLQSGEGKIVVVQTAFLGDVILVTALLRAIRNLYPKIKLSVVVIPECADLLRNLTDEVITFDKKDRRRLRDNWQALIKRIRDEHFDLALVPHRSFRSGLTVLKAGIPHRIGFSRGLGKRFQTISITYPQDVYEGARNLKLLTPLSPGSDDGIPHLNPSKADHETADSLLMKLGLSRGKFVVFAPGSVWKSKQWLIDYYCKLRIIIEGEYSCPVLTVGGNQDMNICADIVSTPARNLAGKTSLLVSAAIFERSKFIVSGDSAPAHLATAMGTRQLIIFGSTHPRFGFAPPVENARIIQVKKWCRPCSDHGRNFCINFGKYGCLTEIKPDKVIEVMGDWLD